MNKQQYEEYVARTNPTRWRMTCDPGARVLPCSDCAHRIGIELKCDAFLNGITRDVVLAVDKNRDYECAPGIKFTAKEG